jgi:hypothetical protein
MIDDWPPAPQCMFWRLDENHTPVKCQSWEEYFASAERDHHVAHTEITDNIRVSTIFLHCAALGHGELLIENPEFFEDFFETMIFGGPLDRCQCRYRTWDEAVAGHARLCGEVRNLLALSPDELAAAMEHRRSERFRFIREQLLALGLPEEIANHAGRMLNETPDPPDADA